MSATIFVNKKSDLTAALNEFVCAGYEAYRTRINCNCSHSNRRYGALIVNSATQVIETKVIRCRGCAAKWEGGAQ